MMTLRIVMLGVTLATVVAAFAWHNHTTTPPLNCGPDFLRAPMDARCTDMMKAE